MSMFSNWLHPERGYEQAQNQLNQGYGQAQNYYNQGQQYSQPYNNQGQAMYPGLAFQQNALLNPGALESQWIGSYQESPYAKQLQGQAQQNGLDAASSMGLMGSSPALSAIQQGSTNIMNSDRQQYLNDMMQKYMASAGIGQNIYDQGANAANNQSHNAFGMSGNAMQQGQNMANMAYGQQNAQGNLFGGILGAGASLVGDWLTQRNMGGMK